MKRPPKHTCLFRPQIYRVHRLNMNILLYPNLHPCWILASFFSHGEVSTTFWSQFGKYFCFSSTLLAIQTGPLVTPRPFSRNVILLLQLYEVVILLIVLLDITTYLLVIILKQAICGSTSIISKQLNVFVLSLFCAQC